MSAREFQHLPQPQAQPSATEFSGVRIGQLIGLDTALQPLVLFPGQPGMAALPARTVVDIRAEHLGQEVVLQFEQGQALRPIIMGVLRAASAPPPAFAEVEADGERLIVNAQEELVLRCGKASVTLTKAGKVVIRGTSILSRSSGVNRLKGGAVQIN